MNKQNDTSKDKKTNDKRAKKFRKLKGSFVDKSGKKFFFTNEDFNNKLIID
jgi:hypothetical protein